MNDLVHVAWMMPRLPRAWSPWCKHGNNANLCPWCEEERNRPPFPGQPPPKPTAAISMKDTIR